MPLPPVTRLREEIDPDSEMFALLYDDRRAGDWIETFLTIPDEKGRIVRMSLYPQQREMEKNQTFRDNTLKGRQTRASSFILARNFRRMTTGFGLNNFVITDSDFTTGVFRARIRHHLKDMQRAGFDFSLAVDNDEELVIKGLENRYIWASAEQRVTGRGYAIQMLHGSEVAHWKPEHAGEILGGILPAVPDPPYGWVDLESTPKGANGVFYESVMDSRPRNPQSMFTTHLYPWWMEPRYTVDTWDDAGLPAHFHTMLAELRTDFRPEPEEEQLMRVHQLTMGQILWRRLKMREMARTTTPFKQEYVESIDDCFLSTGESFFASLDGIDHLAIHRQNILPPIKVYDSLPYNRARVDFKGGEFVAWELPNPVTPYAMYQDTSKGGTQQETDPSVITVMDARALRVVAKLVVKASPRDVAEMGCAIGEFYNTAMYGGERDAWGAQSLERVREMGYPNIYYWVGSDQRKEPEAWIYPTEANRNRSLQVFREKVFDHTFISKDAVLWQECGMFTWQMVGDRWKAKAAGKRTHDDHVLSAAGCCIIAERAQYVKPKRTDGDSVENLEIGQFGLVRRARKNQPHYWMR